jgi:hypothetical protein
MTGRSKAQGTGDACWLMVMRIGAREARGWRGRTWDKRVARAKCPEEAKEQNFGKLLKAEQARTESGMEGGYSALCIRGRAVQVPKGYCESSLINYTHQAASTALDTGYIIILETDSPSWRCSHSCGTQCETNNKTLAV